MAREVWKGNICYSADRQTLRTWEQGFLLSEDGISQGVAGELPQQWQDVPVRDFGDCLIIPGLVDLHMHAPQYEFRGMGMDLELLEWLNACVFPVEARYADPDYADRAYTVFAEDLRQGATTRACIFGTLHEQATELLMEKLEAAGLCALVGKVNMDRNSPDILRETDAAASAEATVRWLERCSGRFPHVKPILTPRFIPSCSDELMERLAKIQRQYHLPVQSHLSENRSETAWVQELCPQSEFYGDAYDRFGLFGGDGCPTIMAHCVYSDEREQQRMKERGVWVAHCPQSNVNLASGIAPVREFLDNDLRVGLGSDVAGGSSESMFCAVADTVKVSKLYWRLVDETKKPLTFAEAFYLATKGGGSFFGKVGSFEPGYELDALVLDDSGLRAVSPFTVSQRLERICYLHEKVRILEKYIAGRRVLRWGDESI